MATINIYSPEGAVYYQVNFNLQKSYLKDGAGDDDIFLLIQTSIPKADGTQFPTIMVRTTADVPPGGVTATNFSNVCQQWISYFIDGGDIIASSSSSSSSSEEFSSSSSSSEEYSSDSSESSMEYSDSSEGYSSESSENYSSVP